jgi:hypothetical protein
MTTGRSSKSGIRHSRLKKETVEYGEVERFAKSKLFDRRFLDVALLFGSALPLMTDDRPRRGGSSRDLPTKAAHRHDDVGV